MMRYLESSRSGFALVIALSLMAFVLLLLMSISTLVRVETVSASIAEDVMLARQNALLSLNIAIGELQKYAGPDARTTSPGGILDADPSTIAHENVPNPWIAGVWDVSQDFTVDQQVKLPAYLISGNEAKGFNQATDTSYPAGYVQPDVAISNAVPTVDLFRDDQNVLQNVVAPLVEISSRDLQGNYYAYWVSDEGVKVKLNHPIGSEISQEMNNPNDISNYMVSKLPGASAIAGLADLIPGSAIREESLGIRSGVEIPLVVSSVTVDDIKSIFHDVTFDSKGLLTKSTPNYSTTGALLGYGGLKQDLTTGLLAGGFTSTDLQSTIFEPMQGASMGLLGNPGGPQWNQLKSYLELAPSNGSGGNAVYEVRPQQPDLIGVYPVLTFGQLHVNVRIVKHADSDYRVWFYFRPTFVLWNPYNATLEESDYYVGIRLANDNSDRLFWTYGITLSDATVQSPPGDQIDLQLLEGNVMPFKLSVGRPLASGESVILSPPGGISMLGTAAGGMELIPGFRQDSAYAYEVPDSTFDLPSGVSVESVAVGSSPGTGAQGVISGEVSFARTLTGVALSSSSWTEGDVLQFIKGLNFTTFGEDSLDPSSSDSVYSEEADYTNPVELSVASGGDVGAGQYLEDIPANFAISFTMRFADNKLRRELDPSIRDSLVSPWLAHYNPRSPTLSRSPFELDSRGNGGGGDNPSFHSVFFGTDELAGDPGAYGDWVGQAPGGGGEQSLVGFSDRVSIGTPRSVLYGIPRSSDDVRSIGDLMHVNFSFGNGTSNSCDYYAHQNYTPAYAVGNSLADPRLNLDMVERDWFPDFAFNSEDRRAHVYRDYSYHLNKALWDDYFFSTLPIVGNSVVKPSPFLLSNTHLLAPEDPSHADLSNHITVASRLVVDGGFNINSTSVEAWKAVLASCYGVTVDSQDSVSYKQDDASPIVRTPYPLTTAVGSGAVASSAEAFTGFRSLSSGQVTTLAESIVEQVKIRGPFASLADFVNRSPIPFSLKDGAITGTSAKPWQLKGALQAAIDDAGINSGFYGMDSGGTRLSVSEAEAITVYPDAINSDVYYSEFTRDAMAISLAANAPGFLSQADLLARIGGFICSRSDTFKIRGYGEVKDQIHGDVVAQIWCEAVVQRVPNQVDGTNVASGDPLAGLHFGRQFRVVDFRWLIADEI